MLDEQTEGQATYYDYTESRKAKWKTLPKFQTIESETELGSTAIVVRGQIYLVGVAGCDFRGFARYNAETNRWDTLASALAVHWQICMVELHGYIYAISGERNGRYDEDLLVERYSIETDQWENVSPLKPGGYITDTTAVVFKEMILIAGCDFDQEADEEGDENNKLTMQIYNPASDTWHIVYREKLRPRCDPLLKVHKSECYLILQGGNGVNHTTVHQLTCDIEGDLPTVCLGEEIPQNPSISKFYGAFTIDNDVFVNIHRCVYECTNKVTDGGVDLGLLADMISTYYPVVCFTFDKRRYCPTGLSKAMEKPK